MWPCPTLCQRSSLGCLTIISNMVYRNWSPSLPSKCSNCLCLSKQQKPLWCCAGHIPELCHGHLPSPYSLQSVTSLVDPTKSLLSVQVIHLYYLCPNSVTSMPPGLNHSLQWLTAPRLPATVPVMPFSVVHMLTSTLSSLSLSPTLFQTVILINLGS